MSSDRLLKRSSPKSNLTMMSIVGMNGRVSSDRLLKKNSPKSNLTMMSIVGMIGKEVVVIGY